eukprot:jgi/Ulvmu1/11893/UM081_0052.1
MPATYPLCDLFPKALPSPIHLQDGSDGCSLLVLACHCCMIRDGFMLNDSTATSAHSDYSLPAEWNNSNSYWALQYTHDACKNQFVLEGHRNGAQLLVRVMEDKRGAHHPGDAMNVQQLGLNSGIYVPDVGLLNSQSWQGVLSEEAVQRLSDLWSAYMAGPLMESATARQPSAAAASLRTRKTIRSGGCPYSYLSSSTAITAVTVAAGVALAGVLFAYRSQVLSVSGIGRQASR